MRFPSHPFSGPVFMAMLCLALCWVSFPGAAVEGEGATTEADAGTVDGGTGDNADDAGEPEPQRPIPVSVTTSGGVSLGGYQAGYLYYLTEVVNRNPQLFEPMLVTGSSAGTINSMIALVALGKEPVDSPLDSLFFQLWTQFKFDDLLDVENAPPLALSSRAVIEQLAQRIEDEWNTGLDTDLDMVMGATATRVHGRMIHLNDDFSVPRQEEKFVFRVRGMGPGRLPQVTNYVDETFGIGHPLLPFSEPVNADDPGKTQDFQIIKEMLFASSAFPLAFPPQEIGFCLSNPELADELDPENFRDCPSPRYRELFVDGSMFDRNPLRLAYQVATAGLQQENGHITGWKKLPDTRNGTLPDHFYFMYLDSGHVSFPTPKEEERSTAQVEALFPSFGAYSQGFVRASQAKELYTLIDENPAIRDRIDLSGRDLPTVSGMLANFFGFFDRKFRIFDFYLGMHDARRYFHDRLERLVDRQGELDFELPEDTLPKDGSADDGWGPFMCMRAVLDGETRYRAACDGKNMLDFRILLQVSVDRLYDTCRRLPEDESVDHLMCKQAMGGEPPPVIQRMVDDDFPDAWMRGEDEREFEYTMRLLTAYRFHFQDLGLTRRQAWLAMSEMRELLAGTVDAFAKRLSGRERRALRTLGKPALNFFMYQPPQTILYLAAGTAGEFGGSFTGKWAPARWVRFNLALQFQGLDRLISPAPNIWAFTPLVGLEFETIPLSGAMGQFKLGVRAGYQLSTQDRVSSSMCNIDRFASDSALCSAPVGQAIAVFSLFERVRIQAGLEWFPYFLPPMDENGKNVFNGFIEIGWQWISPF